jgi:hypothetical protein
MAGQTFGDDKQAWAKWWSEEQGFYYQPPPKHELNQQVDFRPGYRMSCFAAGTPVQTLDGPRPIETLSIGDRVLSQDVRTGELVFVPVLITIHNKPSPTVRVTLDNADAPIVVTPIHHFWKVGQGWIQARYLKPGDALRLLGGSARVAQVEEEKIQPVFNLEVAQTHSFFVGAHPALVHDNSLIESVTQPFDAEPTPGPLARAEAPATQP